MPEPVFSQISLHPTHPKSPDFAPVDSGIVYKPRLSGGGPVSIRGTSLSRGWASSTTDSAFRSVQVGCLTDGEVRTIVHRLDVLGIFSRTGDGPLQVASTVAPVH